MGSEKEIDSLALDIGRSLNLEEDKKDDLELLVEWIVTGKAKNILVLCGAGVSVSAGIPDFRTPGSGLYDNLQKYDLPFPQAIFDVDFYRQKPRAFCTLAQELWPGLTHSPTLTHSFIKLLSDKGLLLRNYTQNIDGLEILAGLPESTLIECHGHFRTASCIDCRKPANTEEVKMAIVEKGTVPKCFKCRGNVKPDIVFFGESLPGRFHGNLRQDVRKCDLMLILGTSLQVAPVSSIPDMVNCPRVLFNRELVLNMKKDDIFIQGDCDENILRLCSLLEWKGDLLKQNKRTKIEKDKVSQEDKDTSNLEEPARICTPSRKL